MKVKYIQAPTTIASGGAVKVLFFVMKPAASINTPKTTIKLNLISGKKVIETVSTSFVGPVNN